MRLETKRTLIRNTEFRDYQGFFDIYKDEETANFAGLRKMLYVDEAKILLFRLQQDPYVEIYSCFLKKTNELIGTISISKTPLYGNFEIGYAILRKYRNQGFCFEILDKLLKVFSNSHNVKQYQAIIKNNNVKSKRLIEKLGFKYVGHISLRNDLIYTKLILSRS